MNNDVERELKQIEKFIEFWDRSRVQSAGADQDSSAPASLMFRGYSERTRRLIFLARWMSAQRGSGVVEMDDLLMALLKEDQGAFAATFSRIPEFREFKGPRHKAYLETALVSEVLRKIDAILPHSKSLPVHSEILLSRAVKDSLKNAGELSERSGGELKPLHLLAAALTSDEWSKGVELLRQAGITARKVLEDINGDTDNSLDH